MAIDVNISTEFIKDIDTPATYSGQGTKKLVVKEDETGIEFVPDSSGSDTNIMNANLTANANRTQDMNSFSMYFNNGKQFKWLNNVAPTIGEGSFDLQGYGTTSSDVLFSLKNGASQSKIRVNGVGRIGINSNPFASARFYVSANSGEYAGYFDASDEIGVYAVSSTNRAVYAFSSAFTGVEGISTNGKGGHFKSSNNYSLWAQSTDAINKQSILSNGLCDFKNYADTITIMQLKDNGRINMPNLPTSVAGLATGDLWNDSGTIKIA